MLPSRFNPPVARASAILLAFAVQAPAALFATDHSWTGPNNGTFAFAFYWLPIGVPGPADRAIFSQSAVHTVGFTTNPTNSELRVGNDRVTFSLASHTYTLTATTDSSISIGGGNVIGVPQTGQLTLLNGTLVGSSADVGAGLFYSGAITASTGSTWNNSALLNVGLSGTGSLSVTNGGHVSCAIGTIGYDTTAHGSASVSSAGSTLSSADWLDVGGSGTGTLTIQNGGHVSNPKASIGAGPGSMGTVTVDGTGSLWDFSNSAGSQSLKVGEYGMGTLNVQNGGLVNNHNSSGGPASIIGDQYGSTGTATIDAAAWTNSYALQVGNIGTGHLILQNDAYVTANPLYIGYGGGGNSTVVVGTNSSLLASALYVGGSSQYPGGNAVLTIDSGGEVSTIGNTTKFYGPGTINLEADGTLETSILESAGGTFHWTGGTLRITDMPLPVDSTGPLGANVTVGAGMFLDTYPSIQVANADHGTLTVSAGGQVWTYASSIAGPAGVTGAVTVAGDGANWTALLSPFVVGDGGDGTLSIQLGGLVQGNAVDVGGPAGIIGNYPGSTGHVTVDGAGSEWSLGPLLGPTYLDVGEFGTGTLTIQNGGLVSDNYGGGTIGTYSNSNGSVTVTDPGSEWLLDVYGLIVGWYGTGILTIQNGGYVHGGEFAASTSIGDQPAANGAVTIDGAGSTFDAGDVTVGNAGAGELEVKNGATLTATSVHIAENANAQGTASLHDPGSTLTISGSQPELVVGGASTGDMTISNGGGVAVGEVFLGDSQTGVGTLTVSGAGSLLTSSDEVNVGYAGLGTLSVQAGGAVSAANGVTVRDGSVLELAHGSLTTTDVDLSGGTLSGTGTIAANLNNAGTLAPGQSPGTITLTGNYTQAAPGTLAIEVAGGAAGQFDTLAVSGSAALDGTLSVALLDNYVPPNGQTFAVLSAGSVQGLFATITPVNFPAGLQMSVHYNPDAVVLEFSGSPIHPGDLNCDGEIDFGDINPFVLYLSNFTAWQTTYTGCPPENGDINGDGFYPSFGDINPFVALLTGG